MTLDPTSLSPNGRQVRCVRCTNDPARGPSRAEAAWRAAAGLAPERDLVSAAGTRKHRCRPRHADDANARLEPCQRASKRASFYRPGNRRYRLDLNDGRAVLRADRTRLSNEVEAPPTVPSISTRAAADRARPPRSCRPKPEKSGGAQDIENVADGAVSREARLLRLRWPLSRLQTGFSREFVLDAILVGWRSDVVRALPKPHPSIPCSACP